MFKKWLKKFEDKIVECVSEKLAYKYDDKVADIVGEEMRGWSVEDQVQSSIQELVDDEMCNFCVTGYAEDHIGDRVNEELRHWDYEESVQDYLHKLADKAYANGNSAEQFIKCLRKVTEELTLKLDEDID